MHATGQGTLFSLFGKAPGWCAVELPTSSVSGTVETAQQSAFMSKNIKYQNLAESFTSPLHGLNQIFSQWRPLLSSCLAPQATSARPPRFAPNSWEQRSSCRCVIGKSPSITSASRKKARGLSESRPTSTSPKRSTLQCARPGAQRMPSSTSCAREKDYLRPTIEALKSAGIEFVVFLGLLHRPGRHPEDHAFLLPYPTSMHRLKLASTMSSLDRMATSRNSTGLLPIPTPFDGRA